METVYQNINWLAVVVAAVSSFALGSLWYSALMFQKPWMKGNNFTDESNKDANMLKIFGLAFVLMFAAAFLMAAYLGADAGVAKGIKTGIVAGVFWVMSFTGVTYLFEQKPLSLFLINAGYSMVALTIMGAIIGAWQ